MVVSLQHIFALIKDHIFSGKWNYHSVRLSEICRLLTVKEGRKKMIDQNGLTERKKENEKTGLEKLSSASLLS